MKYHKLLHFTFGLGVGFLGTSCCALQTYPLVDQQSTTVTISQTEQNRIAVLGDRIGQVFGAEGRFDVESDEEGGQIFLIMARPAYSLSDSTAVTKPMTITIITEEGLTQDLKLIPKDIEAQSILLKPTLSLPEEPQETHLQQVIKLLKAMVKNEEALGYTKVSLEKKAPAPSLRFVAFNTLKVEHLFTYTSDHSQVEPSRGEHSRVEPSGGGPSRGSPYEGKIFSLTNYGKETLSLKEADFALSNDAALSLSKTRIHEGETIVLYVISRRDS